MTLNEGLLSLLGGAGGLRLLQFFWERIVPSRLENSKALLTHAQAEEILIKGLSERVDQLEVRLSETEKNLKVSMENERKCHEERVKHTREISDLKAQVNRLTTCENCINLRTEEGV